MTTRDIAKLTCRLLALYFALFALNTLPYLLFLLFSLESFNSSDPTFTSLLFSGGGFLGNMAVSLLLWAKAGRVSWWLEPQPKEVTGRISFRTLQKLAFSVVGLVLAVLGFADLLQEGVLSFGTVGTDRWDAAVGAAIRLILGLWLLFGVDSFMNLLGKLEQNRIPQNVQNNPEREV